MKKLILHWPVFILLVLTLSCQNKKTTENETTAADTHLSYAEGFKVNRGEGYTEVIVNDPWKPGHILHRYILVPREKDLPKTLPEGTLIRTPLERVSVFSSVHCSLLDELGAIEKITGVCDSKYIAIPYIQNGLSIGSISDLGVSMSPDVEKIIDLKTEAVFVSPMQNMGYGRLEKIQIPLIECSDYMETSPLGRAEWIKFLGLFLGKEQKADSLFKAIENRYNTLKKEIPTTPEKKPTVISEMKTGSAWYVPGGHSYMARLFADAGADYIWADNDQSGSIALPFESVFEKGKEADFWLIKYNRAQEMSYNDLKDEYPPYANFDAFKKGNIFTCNTGKVPFYERIPLHPDELLSDLIKIFYPGSLANDTLRYFNPMKK